MILNPLCLPIPPPGRHCNHELIVAKSKAPKSSCILHESGIPCTVRNRRYGGTSAVFSQVSTFAAEALCNNPEDGRESFFNDDCRRLQRQYLPIPRVRSQPASPHRILVLACRQALRWCSENGTSLSVGIARLIRLVCQCAKSTSFLMQLDTLLWLV